MLRFLRHLVAVLLVTVPLRGETFDLSWPTSHAAKPPESDLTPAQARWLPAFRTSLEWLPEPAIITLALSQSQILGLPPETGPSIAPLIAARYEAMIEDLEFATAPSHLPYGYSATRPTEGLARVTTPAAEKIAAAPVIVFIHGQGGSFLWYQHWLKSTLPDHVIISPACGANPAFISAAYIEESLSAAEQRLGRAIPDPILVGLSAGGFAAQRIAIAAATRWQRVIVLGAYRAPDVSPTRWRGRAVDYIVGADEYFVRDGTLARDVGTLRRSGAQVGGVSIPGANHFFILTHPVETERALLQAVSPPSVTER